jgi:iron complex transport system substrate-binding protein
MKTFKYQLILFLILSFFISCKKETTKQPVSKHKIANSVVYAKGFELYKYEGYTVLKINDPWPKANKTYTYILKEKNGSVPDSLQKNIIISVPIKTVIATSTTHISALSILGEEKSLVGFPNLDYISSPKVRNLIEKGKVKELGNNQTLSIETAIDLSPSAVVTYGLDNNNPIIDNLEKSGLKVILNGDWNEQSPLGKAEWIKFFGVLYGKEDIATTFFESVVNEYKSTLQLVQTNVKPTVLSGSMFEQVWFVPQGESWGAQFIKDAGGNYLWANEKGTGGLPLSFEKVLERAKEADFWIGPGQFSSLLEMQKSNPHYIQFKAFKNKNVYSYSLKKGDKGGIVYFEDAPNRPDLVLKDLVKIFHPELLVDYQLHFFQKLK